jgi:hypothetical protein
MGSSDLKILLDGVPDTRELVLRRCCHPVAELQAWRDASADAAAALADWRARPGSRRAYAAYRAAQDREDAAQDALSSST